MRSKMMSEPWLVGHGIAARSVSAFARLEVLALQAVVPRLGGHVTLTQHGHARTFLAQLHPGRDGVLLVVQVRVGTTVPVKCDSVVLKQRSRATVWLGFEAQVRRKVRRIRMGNKEAG